MMTVLEQLDAILANCELDAERGEDTSRCIEIERLAEGILWSDLAAALMTVLEDDDRPLEEYRVVAEVIWGAVLDGRPFDIDRTIALLLHRLESCGEEDNLVWSITCKLKGVGYLSSFDARADPGVAEHLKRLTMGRQIVFYATAPDIAALEARIREIEPVIVLHNHSPRSSPRVLPSLDHREGGQPRILRPTLCSSSKKDGEYCDPDTVGDRTHSHREEFICDSGGSRYLKRIGDPELMTRVTEAVQQNVPSKSF